MKEEKKPLKDFIPLAEKGAIELTFCDLFHSNGEPKWKQMGEFLNGVESSENTFLDAVELAVKGEPNPPAWEGVPPEKRRYWIERIARQILAGKPPLPDQRLKAACWLWDAYTRSGGDIPKGVREGITNIRRLKIQNPDLSDEELKQAHKDSGLSEEALKHAREFCNDFEGLRLDDGRISAP